MTLLSIACRRNACVIFFVIFPSNLCLTGMGEMKMYYNALKIEHAHNRANKLLTIYNQKIINFQSIYYFDY